MIRGVIFDLDGTLVDSRLDFDAMRRDMGFPPGQFILEGLEALPVGPDRDRCLKVLHEHEERGALAATLMPGARELLEALSRGSVPHAILTRNSRSMTQLALDRLDLRFSHVVTREDGPPKPDPAGVLAICRAWGLSAGEVLLVGDHLFDLVCGRAAGVTTVLYAPEGTEDEVPEADFVIAHLDEVLAIVGR